MRTLPRILLPVLLPVLLSTLLLTLGACVTVERSTVVDAPAAPAVAPRPETTSGTETSQLFDVATAPLDAEIPFTEELRHGVLENGLTYYIRRNERPENRADLRLILNVGSLQEDDDQQGLAHFVEHMAFNGTRNFEKQELVDYLESIGMRFGADLNASTSFDETMYLLKVPTDDLEILEKAFVVLEDWAHGITFDPEEVDKERGVVIEEWRLGLGAQARIRDEQFPLLFQGSRYAERLPIGEVEILENAPAETLRRFYEDWYRPDLMAVVAVGDFDPDQIESLIRERMGRIPATPEPRPREVYPVPDHEETLWSFLTDPELPTTSVSIYTKLPRDEEGDVGDYRRSLVEGLYHGMLNSRLGELAQTSDPPFLFGYAAKSGLVRSRSVYVQGAAVEEGGVERGLETVLREAERVDRHGFTETELARAKLNLRRGYEQAYRERDKLPSSALASEAGRNFLEGEPIPGIATELALVERFLPTVTLDEVNELAQSWITDENRVILVSGPEKAGADLPSKDDLLAVFEAVETGEVEPWLDATVNAPLVALTPEPGEVVETRAIEEVGVEEWRLANGVRVVMKPTDFKNDQVLLAGFSPGGHSLVSDADHTSASFATSIVGESGYGEFGSIELRKALAGKVAGGSPYISELEEGFRGSASPEDLDTLLKLLYLAFTAPRFDEEAFESLEARWKILIENRLSQPEAVFGEALTEALTKAHPRRRPLTMELLDEIDPERALEIYAERFADAADFTFVLVGNFTPETIRPLVETWLGGLPATGREETWRDVGVERPEGVERVEIHKGLEPKSQVRLVFQAPATWSREARHDVRSLARILEMRFRDVLREDLGGTYGVAVSGSISRRPREEVGFWISFGADPEEVDGLVDTLFVELAALRRGDEEAMAEVASSLENVKESIRRQRETQLEENGFWLASLESSYTYGEDPRLILEELDQVEAVTPERVRAAARKYLDPEDGYVLGVLYPAEEVEAAEEPEEPEE